MTLRIEGGTVQRQVEGRHWRVKRWGVLVAVGVIVAVGVFVAVGGLVVVAIGIFGAVGVSN